MGGMISAYLTDTVTVLRHTGFDQWGEPNSPTQETVPARVQMGFKNVRDNTGAEVVASGSVLLESSVRPGLDRLLVNGAEVRILNAVEEKGFSASHWEASIA